MNVGVTCVKCYVKIDHEHIYKLCLNNFLYVNSCKYDDEMKFLGYVCQI